MTRLTWDPSSPVYEVGIDRGVFYPANGSAEAWVGLISVDENPDVTDTPLFLDGVNVGRRQGRESFNAFVRAYTVPDVFWEDLMSQRKAAIFDFSYRTTSKDGDQIHFVYNASAKRQKYLFRQLETEPYEFLLSTLPIELPFYGPTSHVYVDTAKAHPEALAALEDTLYGSDTTNPRMPGLNELIELFEEYAVMIVVDNGDGTWTATGPDEAFEMLDANTFQIAWPSALYITAHRYVLSSY